MRMDLTILATLAAAFAAVAACGSPTSTSGADAASVSGSDGSSPAGGADAAASVSHDASLPAASDAATPGEDAAEAPGLDASVAADAHIAGLDAAAGLDAEQPDAAQPDAGPRCVPDCAAGETCLETSCVPVAFSTLCGLGRATVLTDGQAADDEVVASIGQAAASACGAGFEIASASLGDLSVFDSASGRLLTPMRELAITAGGFYFNPLVGALERTRKSPLYFTSDATAGIGWASSATGAPVHLFAEASVTDAHDYFVVELFPDDGGRLVLVDYGIGVAGTRAAGRQAELVLASPGTYADAWYVYEWSLDADAGAETTHLIASGR
jgi:hypothetical protein